ncbi:AT-rich interactive domain-containing protein 1A isoform X1 [Bradysia coprophila]|uniref:AT-rich interactive domain-containing protein 1A isoform X1 n=2 Tax=Bradysia coprophila TaxID=38358 RepID=UPI00187DAB07|nr:AT-rich interactive domain-containing protein 1A isoform X1 [Bradysia coprophila]
MASVQRKLVHKQFNSPIGLYSDNNVKATLNRELKVLSNGTMGIDFDDISKPANLANSAVLRMLEEEENQKRHGRQPGGLKRVAWPPEPEYQSPSGVAPQPQQSPAQGNTYHQSSQNQYPSQYNNNARQPSHDNSAVEQRSPYRQEQTNYPQPVYQQQHTQSYPTQPSQPQQTYNYYQSAPVDNHPQPIYQRQHSQSQARQIRATPGRAFPNPDPCFMKINKPAYLQPTQPIRAVSPSTTAFAGGVAVNAPQQSQYPAPGYANGGASPQYQSQPSPNYQQQSSPSQYQQQQPQSSPQYQPSPQYQSNSSLPLSPDPNRSLPGWSPVRKPVQVNTGYTLNNQRPSAEPYSGQSYAGNQNQYQQQTSPSYQPSANYDQYQPQQAPQQQQPQYQPQQQQYQSTPSNEHQYQAQQPYYRQPSPGVITLRKEAPFNQEPAPVFTSSPSAASFGGGTNMRGDQKWPPQEYKLQSEIDNEARRRLAQGPVLRPRRVQKDKDIKAFFDQHAIHNQYRYYNVPPGTQAKLNYF